MTKFNGVFKHYTTKLIPKNAKVVARKDGSQYVRYRKKTGFVVNCEVKNGRIRIPSTHYYMMLGGRRINLRISDKQVAIERALEIFAKLERGEDPFFDKSVHESKPLLGDPKQLERIYKPKRDRRGKVIKTARELNREQLREAISGSWLAEFEHHIRATANRKQTDRYIRDVIALLRRDLIAAGLTSVEDMRREKHQKKFSKYFLSLTTPDKTRRDILERVRRFERFLLDEEVITSIPISKIGKNLSTGKQRFRRVWSCEEIQALLNAAEIGEVVAGVTGKERSLIYRTALFTGFRAGELSRFIVGHVDAERRVLVLPSRLTKNRKLGAIPIVPSLLRDLVGHIADRGNEESLFNLLTATGHQRRTERMMKHDCKAAGIEYETSDGFADFHSLRTTFINALRTIGIQDSLRKEIARHGDIKTTRGSYDSIAVEEMRPAIDQLEELGW